ncbi:unnamed protein product (mitochondrion) [Plasmodiophora brassicae]|uniref:ABM domain-containing protein n=1 Tax=Plasmodiophora brassicae TaxID=37360 RepID=A0A0G4J8C9_PLABS|nr:hypothetical protein PBRA_003485 [Plasmodiophora brassicae]SPQ99838.1 unnamed protein product [Plasmodiophora brassicae]
MTVHVISKLRIQSDKVNDAKALFNSLLVPSRAHAGCIKYNVYQDRNDPQEFAFIEEWQTEKALDDHLATDLLKQGFARVGKLVETAPVVQRLNFLG